AVAGDEMKAGIVTAMNRSGVIQRLRLSANEIGDEASARRPALRPSHSAHIRDCGEPPALPHCQPAAAGEKIAAADDARVVVPYMGRAGGAGVELIAIGGD